MKWGRSNPKKAGWYLVTLNDRKTVMPMYRMDFPAGYLSWQGLACGSEVIASIKFPKPYGGERQTPQGG